MAYSCNELAACALTVINNSPCTQAQEFTVEIQKLSHAIARAGKTLNHLIKKGGRSTTSKRKMSIDTQQKVDPKEKDTPAVQTSIDSNHVVLIQASSVVPGRNDMDVTNNTTVPVAMVDVESRTSMATGQLTQSPEHVGHVTSKEDHVMSQKELYNNVTDDDDDDDDSTLI